MPPRLAPPFGVQIGRSEHCAAGASGGPLDKQGRPLDFAYAKCEVRGPLAPLQPPACGYVDDALRAPASSLRSARGQPCWTARGQQAAHRLTTGIAHRLPSLRPHTHRPQLRGLRPCSTNFFKFSLLVLNRGCCGSVDNASVAHPLAPTHPLPDRPDGGPCAEGHTGGEAQGVWGQHAPAEERPRRGLEAGELMRPRWGALYGGGGAAPKAWGTPQGCPANSAKFDARRMRRGRNAKSLKIKDSRKGCGHQLCPGVRTPAVSGVVPNLDSIVQWMDNQSVTYLDKGVPKHDSNDRTPGQVMPPPGTSRGTGCKPNARRTRRGPT